MTPEEIREFERQEFEAESARLRQIAYAMVGQNPAKPVPKIETKPEPIPKPPPQPRPQRVLPPLNERPFRFNPQGELLTAHGKTMTRSEWAKHLGISIQTLRMRMKTKSLEDSLVPGKLKTGRPPKQRQCPCANCPYREDK